MSVAFGFFGALSLSQPVLMSQTTGLCAGTSGSRPKAYFTRFGIPSLVITAESAAVLLLLVVPNHCILQDSTGVKIRTGETIPCKTRSGAGVPATSKTYHVPADPPP